MTHWTLHKINIFPGVNGPKKIIFSNPFQDSVKNRWNKFIREYTYWFYCFSMIYIPSVRRIYLGFTKPDHQNDSESIWWSV